MIYPKYLKKASLILAVSERARQDIVEILKIDPGKVKTVYLAVDPIFRVVEDNDFLEMIRKKYDLPSRYLLYVGHIYPGKNIGRLFKAFAKVRADHDIKLVVAGSFRWKYDKDLQLIHELGLKDHIQLKGHIPTEDLVGFYNLAQLTVFPSYYESFGLPNLEANACGCPLVTSNTGGSPEAAGDAAIYVEPTDVDGIAEAMLKVLTDEKLRIELIQKGFENIKRFSWDKTARLTLEALESVVD